MLNFSDLVQDNDLPQKPVEKQVSKKIHASTLLGIPKKLSITEAKELKEELHKIEPGFKIGSGGYKQIAQYCDHCDDIKSHVLNDKGTKIRCLCCKKDKTIKVKTL